MVKEKKIRAEVTVIYGIYERGHTACAVLLLLLFILLYEKIFLSFNWRGDSVHLARQFTLTLVLRIRSAEMQR